MAENKLIGFNLLDENLTYLINSMAKSYPSNYTVVESGLNPDNYEYIKIIDDSAHKSEVYRWDGDSWVLVGTDEIVITWDEVKSKPVSFFPVAHTHTKADITDFAHTHAELAPINHNHDGVYSPVGHNHNTQYSPIDHTHDTQYSPLTHNHDGRYYTQAQVDAITGNLLNLQTTDQSSLVAAINELKSLIGSGTGGGSGDMPLLVVEDEWEGSTNITKTFSTNCMGFSIVNQGTAMLIATINGKTIQVDPQESFQNIFKPFKTLTIAATGNYKALVTAPYGIVATVDTTPPNNVTNLAATNITGSSLTLTWVASTSSDVDGYDVYQGANKIASVTGTSYNVSGLSVTTSYVFTVKARDISGNVASGTSVNATTTSTVDTVPPTDVTGLGASNIGANGATLNWTVSGSSDIYSYEIYNGTTLLGSVLHSTSTYNVTGLNQGTSYTLTVKSKDLSGNISTGTPVSFSTITPVDTTPPVITASPAGGTYSSANVVLSANEASTIYYTTDGTTPTTSSSVYNGPISITATTTLKYFGKDTAGNSSAVQTQTYTITAAVGGGTVLFNDTFNRADNTAIGTSDSGVAWTGYTNINGTVTMGIRNNMAYMSGGTWNASNKFRRFTTIPISSNNFKIEFVPKILAGSSGDLLGVCIRMPVLDGDMIYLQIPTPLTGVSKYSIAKIPQGGSVVTLGQSTKYVSENDVNFTIEHYSDGQIKFYVDGALQIAITDTLGLGASTKVGIGANANIVGLGFDSFKVTQM